MTESKTVTYKGASLAKRGIKRHAADGWTVIAHTTHRKFWSWWTGCLLFRRRRHVVTFTLVQTDASTP